jgi:hypothetical protein
MAAFFVHYLVPVPQSPNVSGRVESPIEQVVGQPLGHQGQAYGPLCRPGMVLTPVHRGSGEPWAVTCPACKKLDKWKEDSAKNPHPRLFNADAEVDPGCCG